MTINQIIDSNSFAKPSSTLIDSQKTQTLSAANTNNATNPTNAAALAVSTFSQKFTLESISDEQVQQAVEQIKSAIDKLTQDLRFSIDEETGKTVVKILDSETQEVIRQFPTEEAISIARTLDKVQGLLFNDKA